MSIKSDRWIRRMAREQGMIEPEHLGLAPGAFEQASIADRCIEQHVSLQESKRQVVHAFEREYLTRLMARCSGNVTHAAQHAQKERRELGKLLKRHGLR